VVFLRDRADHPQVQRRFDLTKEMIGMRTSVVHEVWSEGESPLARIFSIICLGDFVSFYLACLNSVDPTPVPVIETLKQKLGA
jgi:glucose/mannose-6-phosphate isomerase